MRMSTSLTSEPLPCSALRCSVSRIKRSVWLRIKGQCCVVGGIKKKKLAILYLSVVRKKKRWGKILSSFILKVATGAERVIPPDIRPLQEYRF